MIRDNYLWIIPVELLSFRPELASNAWIRDGNEATGHNEHEDEKEAIVDGPISTPTPDLITEVHGLWWGQR